MSVLFYEMTIPVYVRSLRQLSVVLKKGEQWAADNAVPPERLLKAKLAPDMLALPFQVHSATNTALLGLGGLPQPMPIKELAETVTFADLHGYIDTGLEKLTAVEPKSWAGKDESSMVVHRLGKDWEVAPVAYMQMHGLPNFFFHVTTAYDILRAQGVPVGKSDFLGSREGLFKECSLESR